MPDPHTYTATNAKKKKHTLPAIFKLLSVLLILILFFPIVGFCINTIVCLSTLNEIKTADDILDTRSDYILVLGAGIQPDGEPSPILQERLDTAILLFEAEVAPRIIISGGADTIKSETSTMKNYLLKHDIPKNAIISDNRGYNTYASINNLLTYDTHSVVIVSQRFHLYRALYIAKHLDFEAIGCTTSTIDVTDNELIYREFLARIKDFIQVHLGNEIWPELDV